MANATADTTTAWQALLANPAITLIRTQTDWDHFVALSARQRIAFFAGTTNAGVDPLLDLSPRALRAFSSSLTFTEGGLARCDYSSLIGALSTLQFKALWAAFGLSDRLVAELGDRDGPATCTRAAQDGRMCTNAR